MPRRSMRSRLPEPEPELDSEAHLLRQELAGSTLLAAEREREMGVLLRELDHARHEVTEQRTGRDREASVLAEKLAEISELKAKLSKAERDAETETEGHLQRHAALEAARQSSVAALQQSEAKNEALTRSLQTERTARAELQGDLELARQYTIAQAALVAGRESEAAEALASAGVLRMELQALEGRLRALETELSGAHIALAAKAGVEQELALLRDQQNDAAALERTCTHLRQEGESLKRQLSASARGKEMLDVRERLNRMEEEKDKADRLAANLAVEAARLTETRARAALDHEALRKRCEAAERRAESTSESTLQRDCEVLRGIVARQKTELQEQHVAFGRLRQAQIGLRLVYGAILLLAMAGVAAAVFWVQHSASLAEWLR